MKTRPLVLCAMLLLGNCRDPNLVNRPTLPDEPPCGDGVAHTSEACDGLDLKGATCVSLGFEFGDVSCTPECQLNTEKCVKLCGNGVIDSGEECDGNLGDFTCSVWGYKNCTSSCKVETKHCVTEAFASAPTLALSHGGPAIITDISPKGAGDLVVANPSFDRLETFSYSPDQGLSPARKLSFGHFPIYPLATDFDGDGDFDLASINFGKDVAIYRYSQDINLFVDEIIPESNTGATCSHFSWVGQGSLDSDSNGDLVALSCPSALPPLRAGGISIFYGATPGTEPLTLSFADIVAAQLTPTTPARILFVTDASANLRVLESNGRNWTEGPSLPLPFIPTAFAPGDFDGDLDLDLMVIDGDFVKTLENTGTGFIERDAISTTTPEQLTARDFDLDGRFDFAWVSGNKVLIRRNMGQWAFRPFEYPTGAGALVSFSNGDLDNDGDLDLAVSYNPQDKATNTYLFINKAR